MPVQEQVRFQGKGSRDLGVLESIMPMHDLRQRTSSNQDKTQSKLGNQMMISFDVVRPHLGM